MDTRFTETRLNQLSYQIIGLGLQVHRELGPGLLETAYEECLAYELRAAGLQFTRQQPCPIRYKDVVMECGYRTDLIIEEALIVEVKAVQEVLPIHRAQLLTYLKLAQKPLGLIMNFHVPTLKEGIERLIQSRLFYPPPPSPTATPAQP